ncbi:MAG TPA: methylenetetrahydrofolate--tRNA-(uracil(54)-C(5))-methyltransferase (FADH(2)-oxidizing) TrmFO [Aggregatilineales bacterium]|nr:methylenetetrahydrofolate--tRNA-(uracil(54)-C(5))-methyltransferase (FADH(2)-oxidizing) TrmFO [Aggregatilineales bacterium]
MIRELVVIGGGLAGTEAAWQAAEAGIPTWLYEMRPRKMTPAHMTGNLAELVCSNSLGSDLPDRAPGLLKNELRRLNSLLIRCAERAAVPAGRALAVDRERFAHEVSTALEAHPLITIVREEVLAIPDTPTIIASGPLTADTLAGAVAKLAGQEYLYFYDALAPIVSGDSINMDIAFRASRYDHGDDEPGDYINCPLSNGDYKRFLEALLAAETTELHRFEQEDPRFFEGCLPVEQIARRGDQALAFGPMRPVGIIDPRTGERPYAVVQLRQDNLAGTLYNIVGFQTNLKWGDQEQVLRLIPGLENAEFVRLGQMHRNTFINSPVLLDATLQFRERRDLFFAGQIVGVEGYVGNIATGLLAGVNAARWINAQPLLTLPRTTMLGALCHYIAFAEPKHFQPMKANFGILPPLESAPHVKRDRAADYARRALADLEALLARQSS